MSLLSVISSVQADITNPSFEEPSVDDGGYTLTVAGWTKYQGPGYGAPGILNPGEDLFTGSGGTGNLPTPALGKQCAFANPAGALYQNVGVIQADTLYSLTIATGQRKDTPIGAFEIALRGDVFNDNDLAFLSSSMPGANVPAADAFVDNTISFNSHGSSWVGHDLFVVMYTPYAAGGPQAMWDNVRLTTSAVPEPGTLTLFGFWLIGLLAYAWRKRK